MFTVYVKHCLARLTDKVHQDRAGQGRAGQGAAQMLTLRAQIKLLSAVEQQLKWRAS